MMLRRCRFLYATIKGAHGRLDGGSGIRTGYREALSKSGGDVAGPESDQFLIGVYLIAITPCEALGCQHTAGEADQSDAGRGSKKCSEAVCGHIF